MQRNKFLLILLVLVGLSIGSASVSHPLQGQTLRRKANLGVQLAPVDEALAKENGLKEPRGFIIQGIIPNSTAANVGVQENDILWKVNDVDIITGADFQNPAVQKREGDPISVTVMRKGKEKNLTGTAVGKPYETSDQWEVIYDEVAFEGGKLRRTIWVHWRAFKFIPIWLQWDIIVDKAKNGKQQKARKSVICFT